MRDVLCGTIKRMCATHVRAVTTPSMSCRYIVSQRGATVVPVFGTTSIAHLEDNVQAVCGAPFAATEVHYLEHGH